MCMFYAKIDSKIGIELILWKKYLQLKKELFLLKLSNLFKEVIREKFTPYPKQIRCHLKTNFMILL